MLIRSSTRWVFLTKRYAWKLPSLRSRRCFFAGLAANAQEARLEKLKRPELCPVAFSLPFGLLVVMPRAEHLTHDQWWSFIHDGTIKHITDTFPVEHKHDSFAWLTIRMPAPWGADYERKILVAVDYGS